MRARWLAVAAASLTTVAGLAAPAASAQTAAPASWQPGPDILRQAPAVAPQLTNSGEWTAPSPMVSGSHEYLDGEFVYQDFLYDDSGANGRLPDPNDQRTASDSFSTRTGTYSYPSGAGYGGNAADLVELRVKPVSGATAFRITLTRLADPSLVAATVGIGTASSPVVPVPYGANVTTQASHFLTFHGGTADFDGTAVAATVDQNRAQVELDVPHALWNPQGTTVRLSAGVGLWNAAAHAYLVPQQASDATHPGGAGLLATPAAFFNVAFRESETPASTAHPNAPSAPTVCMWRDCLQAAALASGSIAQFHEDVSFGKLLGGVTDTGGVPTTGSMDRILASHFGNGGGVTYAASSSQVDPTRYDGEYQGNLQPYNLYVPARAQPAGGWPLTLLLHSLSANYNQYMGSNNQTEFGNRAAGTLVATSESRGPDGWYYDRAEADVFEMWAQVASLYPLDLSRTTVTGYSMGGYAAYRFGTRFPDLFAKAYVTVGPPADGIWLGPPLPSTAGNGIPGDPTNTYYMLDSLRWVPIMIWHGTNDELVPAEGPQIQARRLDSLDYRYEMDTFPGYDHFAFAFFDNFTAPTAFLGDDARTVDPPRVTYVVNPTMDFTRDSEVADHAYWLGGLTVRNGATSPRGTIDVRSEAFGVGDAPASATQFGAGVAATPYTREYKTWGAAPSAPAADTLDITATNVGRVVIDVTRARVSCAPKVNLTSDGPIEVDLVQNGQVCSSATLRPASAGGATVAQLGGGIAGLPDTAALAARSTALPVSAVLGALALAGRRRRRRSA